GKDDPAEAKRAGMAYLPVLDPPFGWRNLTGEAAPAGLSEAGDDSKGEPFLTGVEVLDEKRDNTYYRGRLNGRLSVPGWDHSPVWPEANPRGCGPRGVLTSPA